MTQEDALPTAIIARSMAPTTGKTGDTERSRAGNRGRMRSAPSVCGNRRQGAQLAVTGTSGR
jgi:hypothetical protein